MPEQDYPTYTGPPPRAYKLEFVAALRDGTGEAGVTLWINGKMVFAVPYAKARAVYDMLGRELKRARELEKEHGEEERRAAQAGAN